jgi:hypothetical protein
MVPVVIMLFAGNLFPQAMIDIERHGRKIQLDGFLLEWGQKTVRPWPDSDLWRLDVINTPEGLAGYFHTDTAICSSWTFTFDSHRNDEPVTIRIPAAASNIYKVDSSPDGSTGYVIEWLIPWSLIMEGNDSSYVIELDGKSSCGDTLTNLLLSGFTAPPPKIFNRRIVTQIVLIAILVAAYATIRVRLRRQNRRRVSPRR